MQITININFWTVVLTIAVGWFVNFAIKTKQHLDKLGKDLESKVSELWSSSHAATNTLHRDRPSRLIHRWTSPSLCRQDLTAHSRRRRIQATKMSSMRDEQKSAGEGTVPAEAAVSVSNPSPPLPPSSSASASVGGSAVRGSEGGGNEVTVTSVSVKTTQSSGSSSPSPKGKQRRGGKKVMVSRVTPTATTTDTTDTLRFC